MADEGRELSTWVAHWLEKSRHWPTVLREIMYGMTLHDLVLDLKKERSTLDHLFILVVFGDLVGVPILPPYFSMRLLPFIIPSIRTWKRSLLRERDLTDFLSLDI